TPGTALSHLFLGGKLALPRPAADSGLAAAPRPRPVQRTVAAPPATQLAPPKKESPFVMEIISGPSKVEKKFDNAGSGEGKEVFRCRRSASILFATAWLAVAYAQNSNGDEAPPRTQQAGASAAPEKLIVTVGKSMIIDSPVNIQRISYADATLVEAVAVG